MSVTQVSNVLGVQNDVKAIAQRAHEVGAYMVDGAQSVPHVPVNVRDLDCDLMAFSAHKLGGPMGIGVLWGKSEVLDAMPFLTGGEMIDSVTETDAVWAPVPPRSSRPARRTPRAPSRPRPPSTTWRARTWPSSRRASASLPPTADRLNDLPYVDVIGPKDGSRHVSAVAFNVRGVHPHDVASILDMSNVCIRAGHHCAQPLLNYLEVENRATCRASVAFYNDKADIDRLVEGLDKVWSIFGGASTRRRRSMDRSTPASLYNAQFMDHVAHPDYKYQMDDPTYTHYGVNPSCGDELTFSVKIGDDGRIEEAAYQGHGCAVSQASADMMSDLMVDKTPQEAIELCKLFGRMVRGEKRRTTPSSRPSTRPRPSRT